MPVCLEYAEFKTAERQLLAAPWQAAQLMHYQSAGRVVIVIRQVGVEVFVKVLDPGQRPHQVRRAAFRVGLGLDARRFLAVVLVIYFADDFFQYVLDRQQARNAAVLVDDNRHVIVAVAKLLEEGIEPLRFRDDRSGTQVILYAQLAALFIVEVTQQVLRKKYAQY